MMDIKILASPDKQKVNFLEKRYSRRWSSFNRVLFQLENCSKILEGLTQDISCQGVCLCTNGYPIVADQEIKLTIYLPMTTIIGISGNIIWNRISDGEKRVGIVFNNMCTKAQDKILECALAKNER